MNRRDHRARLLRETIEAQSRHESQQADSERRAIEPPRSGDVLGLSETAAYSVLWAVLEAEPIQDPRQFLLVAADLHPFAGSSDVTSPADADVGALSLRCGFEIWLDAAALSTAKRVGRLDDEVLDRARRKRAEIEAGVLTGSSRERETDSDPQYQDWLAEGPARAQAVLQESLGEQTEQEIYGNGVDAVTGDYLTPAFPVSQTAEWVQREQVDPGVLNLLRHVHHVDSQPHLGLPSGLDPEDLAQAGWAVVFHADESRQAQDALRPLIEHRRARIGDERFRVLDYRSGEGWRQWLSRHEVAAGRVQPSKIPYYLLLVGPPTRIPFDFQLLLGVEYAVGRLSLETPEELRCYARSVVEAETRRRVVHDRRAVFFGPRHAFDPATVWSADQLVKPLMDGLPATGEESAIPGVAEGRDFLTRRFWGEAATRANLEAIFHPPSGERSPALVFAAAHGLGWSSGHPRQRASQGALLCQDWPALGQIDPERHCLGAADITGEARVQGSVIFLHAAYSAGTPEHPGFTLDPATSQIAREPFVASLAQRLLGHPRGGAAAVIGLIDPAWPFPASSPAETHAPFRGALDGLLAGWPVGHAVRELKKRYAALTTRLDAMRQKLAMGARLDEAEIAALWSERNSIRGIVVIGDPASRLRV